MSGAFANVAVRIGGLYSVFQIVKGTLGAFVEASNESEKATASLAQALKQQGTYTQATLADLQGYAAELQRATGLSDDATVQTMAQLTAMGLHGEQLKKATALAQDLSVVMGTDTTSAARLMADAFSGNIGMLGRYIKGLDEADIKARGSVSIIEQLTKAVGGQALAMGSTGAGSIKKFSEAWNDLQERFGDLIKSALAPVLELLSNLVRVITDSPPAIQAMALGVVALSSAFLVLGTSMGGLPYIIGAIVTAGAALGIWLDSIINPMDQLANNVDKAARAYTKLSEGILLIKWGETSQEIDELSKEIDGLISKRNELIESEKKSVLSDVLNLNIEIEEKQKKLTALGVRVKAIDKLLSDRKAKTEEQQTKLTAEQEKFLHELRIKNISDETEQKLKSIENEASEMRIKAMGNLQLLAEINKYERQEKSKVITEQREKNQKLFDDYSQFVGRKRELDNEYVLAGESDEIKRSAIARAQLEQRIADLKSYGVRTMAQEEELLKAEIDLRKNETESKVNIDKSLNDARDRIRELQLSSIKDDYERETAEVKLKYSRELEAAKGNADLITAIERAKSRELHDIDVRRIKETSVLYASLTAGFKTAWGSIIDSSKSGAQKWQAIWDSMKQAAWNAIGNILEKVIESAVTQLLTQKTTAAASAVITKVTATEQIITATAATLTIAGVVTAAMAEITAAASSAAALVSIATFGGAAAIGAAAVLTALATVKGAALATAFEKGGVFEKDQRGFIEGGQMEYIMPKRTFSQVMYQDIVPGIINETRARLGGGDGNSELLREVKELKNIMRKKEWSPVLAGTLEGQKFVRVEYPKAERFRKSVIK